VWSISTPQIPLNLTVTTSTDCSEMFVGDFRNFIIGMPETMSIQRADQLFAGTVFCHMRLDVAATYPAAFVKVTGIRPN
jgi:hypothetical protein